jgi:hypothetical protein
MVFRLTHLSRLSFILLDDLVGLFPHAGCSLEPGARWSLVLAGAWCSWLRLRRGEGALRTVVVLTASVPLYQITVRNM